MIDKADIQKLARLARITISDEEIKNLQDDLKTILKYVSEIKSVSSKDVKLSIGTHYNIMREDKEPHESGIFTEDLLREAPQTERGYIKVKKIL